MHNILAFVEKTIVHKNIDVTLDHKHEKNVHLGTKNIKKRR